MKRFSTGLIVCLLIGLILFTTTVAFAEQDTNLGTEKDLYYSYTMFNTGLSALTKARNNIGSNLGRASEQDKLLYLGGLCMLDRAKEYIVSKEFSYSLDWSTNLKDVQMDMIEQCDSVMLTSWLYWEAMINNNTNPNEARNILSATKELIKYESSLVTKRPSNVWYEKNGDRLRNTYGPIDSNQAITAEVFAKWLKDDSYRIKKQPKLN